MISIKIQLCFIENLSFPQFLIEDEFQLQPVLDGGHILLPPGKVTEKRSVQWEREFLNNFFGRDLYN